MPNEKCEMKIHSMDQIGNILSSTPEMIENTRRFITNMLNEITILQQVVQSEENTLYTRSNITAAYLLLEMIHGCCGAAMHELEDTVGKLDAAWQKSVRDSYSIK